MRTRVLSLTLIAVLAIGLSVFAAPPVSDADPVFTIEVKQVTTSGAEFYWYSGTGPGGAAFNASFSLAAGDTNMNWVLGGANALTLAQTDRADRFVPFSFDTSDFCSPNCSLITLRINGIAKNTGGSVYSDPTFILAFGNADPPSRPGDLNEATEYGPGVFVSGLDAWIVKFGYADNLHTGPCADTSGNCQPDPFDKFVPDGNPNAVGAPFPAGFPVSGNPNHCSPASGNCFEGGVIMLAQRTIVTPEPSTLLLLGTGLLGLAALARRRIRG